MNQRSYICLLGNKHPHQFCMPLLLLILLAFFSCKNKTTLFTTLDARQTGIAFVNSVTDSDTLSILDYLYFYNGGGVAVGDINNDGLDDVFFTANKKGGNKLYLNKGNLQFEDITATAGLQGRADWNTGATMADVNGDGLLDIYVSTVSGIRSLRSVNELYVNNGNNTFTEKAAAYGLNHTGFSTQAAFFDMDKDGDLDCYLLNQSLHFPQNYSDTSVRRKPNADAGDKLYRNDNGRFTDITAAAGIYSSTLGYGLGIAIADLNSDGWEDIYVSNDFRENDYYYLNNRNGTFTETGATAFGHYSRFSMGSDVADYNNDGFPDIITLDMLPEDEAILKASQGDEVSDIFDYKNRYGYQHQYARNCLHKNVYNGQRFSDVAQQGGISATDWSWSALFADYDNDGRKDLFITNGIQKRPNNLDFIKFNRGTYFQPGVGDAKLFDRELLKNMPSGAVHNYMYRGTREEIFSDESINWGFEKPTLSNGAAYSDLDNDGDLDLVVNNVNAEAGIHRNNSAGKRWIQFTLQGDSGNRFGIGAKIYIWQRDSLQYQQLMLTRGFQSSVSPVVHFGLGDDTLVQKLMVVWPNQRSQTITGLRTNQRLVLKATDARDSFQTTSVFPSPLQLFTDITAGSGINWSHKENEFYDFNRQYFIPHKISAEGPKLAVADINNDGLDDFYVCGAKNQSGQLFIQDKSGRFAAAQQALFARDSAIEETDAVFFDADNDKDNDLYIVSGGCEYRDGDSLLQDRLYLNDGKGNFAKAAQDLPAARVNKSCAVVLDVNGDGAMDIFLGGRADAYVYGKIPPSFLLLNDGRGQFTDASAQWLNENRQAGMVTAAAADDLNKDGKPDLVLVGEWMPVTILKNTGTAFKNVTGETGLANTTGLWRSLAIINVDGGGDRDILLGNYGNNSKLQAGGAGPLRMYVNDFDKNGEREQLLAINKGGNYYTFLGKEDLEKQLPALKRKFLRYGEMAGKTIYQVFDEKALDTARLFEAKQLSSCFIRGNREMVYTAEVLPAPAQVAPVNAMADLGADTSAPSMLLLGQNFYGTLPYEGRYDAGVGTFLQYNPAQSRLQPVSNWLLNLALTGEVRDLKVLRTARGNCLLVARNNGPLSLYHYRYNWPAL
jgi:enediyne biosynthesis protein E4